MVGRERLVALPRELLDLVLAGPVTDGRGIRTPVVVVLGVLGQLVGALILSVEVGDLAVEDAVDERDGLAEVLAAEGGLEDALDDLRSEVLGVGALGQLALRAPDELVLAAVGEDAEPELCRRAVPGAPGRDHVGDQLLVRQLV